MSTIIETCSCGARIDYDGPAPHAAVACFRDAHAVCRRPPVPVLARVVPSDHFQPVATGMIVATTREGAPLTVQEARAHPEQVWGRYGKP